MKKKEAPGPIEISIRERIEQVDIEAARAYVQKAIDQVNELYSLTEQREHDFAAVIDIIENRKTLTREDKDRIYYHFLSFKRHNI